MSSTCCAAAFAAYVFHALHVFCRHVPWQDFFWYTGERDASEEEEEEDEEVEKEEDDDDDVVYAKEEEEEDEAGGDGDLRCLPRDA